MNKIKKVAIYGMGKSGKSALQLAAKLGYEVFAVSKGAVDSWYTSEGLASVIKKDACFAEEDFTQQFSSMDQIVISPGIPTTHPSLKLAVQKNIPIISEIEFAYQQCPHIPVIAITGTNGKTTTTTMVTEALKKAGKNVFCGGNIGIPYCDLALSQEKFDFAIIEVSSFQLETIKEFHPIIGAILNIFPNHSERYEQVQDYAIAKFRLLTNMKAKDHLILGTENPYLDYLKTCQVQKDYFTKGQLPAVFLSQFDFKQAKVRGEHNEANFYVAWKILELLQIPNLQKLFQEFINEFAGVAHRLEYVLHSEGLSVYNDAKSTNTLATTTAIKAFNASTEPLHLILGGKLRNETDLVLPDLLPYKNKITTIFTIGDVTERLYQELRNDFMVIKALNLKTVFNYCKDQKLKGNLVFSPAFPSFDQFKNYVDRGEKFKMWAKEIF